MMFLISLLLGILTINNFHFNNYNKINLNNNYSSREIINNYLDLENLTAEVVLIKEFGGAIIFNKNADLKKEIASLTKLMSSYLGYLLYPSNEFFTFDAESINLGGTTRFSVGEKITRDDILKATLVSSNNEAIYLLAKSYGLKSFVNLMNQKAKEWQMNNTIFSEPTGLGSNISTAKDLDILLTKIYSQTPEIFDFTRLESVIINKKILWTTNLLLPKYKSIIVGGKTGYKKKSGECLVLILKFEKSPFVKVIILNSKDRWRDSQKIIEALKKYYDQ